MVPKEVKCWHVVAFLVGMVVVLLAVPAFADDGATAAANVDATTGVVTSGGAVGAAGFLYMMLRKVDAFFDRISKHFEAEERALSKIADHIDRWALREDVRRDHITGPIGVVDR